ncbi:MAG TPA: endonuclease/exonuclease/phosphatase family protein [Bryobacteraceae bacterium]|jgi:endonuclease/exonuclease/phosphatase family metal-dependent hydrolase
MTMIPGACSAARLLTVFLALSGSYLCFAKDPVLLKVMTRNMDAGTDFNLVLAATDAASFAAGAAATLDEVQASNIPARAARLADEIAAQRPDLIGLQEATLWRTGPFSAQPAGAATVLYDQLDLLMSELAKRQLHYAVVGVNHLSDIEVPVPTKNLNLRLTDRDAVLARSDVNQSKLDVYNVQTHRYQISLPLGLVSPPLAGNFVYQGFISAEVNVAGTVIQFFNTHLESLVPGNPLITVAQLAETKELLSSMDSDKPIVVLGDFNANAEPGPDDSGTVEMILAAGFTDSWKSLNPTDPGFTWRLYGEDQDAGKPVELFERIDLIFSRGLTPASVQRLSYGSFWGPYASDHVGVAATLQGPVQ